LVANRNRRNYDLSAPFVTPTKPTYATLPLPGIQPVLMDDKRNEITGNQVTGNLCIRFPWPGIARTIWGDHQRYKETYFTAFPGNISRETAL
jgi:acetyl-CoA synthetase